jgi:hypothetical protein
VRGGPASAPAAARRDPDRRRPGLVLLVVFVALAHLLLGDWIAEGMVALGEGRVDREPVRLKAAFVTVLQPVAPPTHAPRPLPPPARRKLPRPLAAASAASAVDDRRQRRRSLRQLRRRRRSARTPSTMLMRQPLQRPSCR